MVGLFINTLPVQVSPAARAVVLPGKDSGTQFERQHYEYSSLAQIHGWSGSAAGVVVRESFAFENYPFEVPEDEQRETISTADAGDTL